MTKMIKGATMWTCDGVKMVQIVERLADGWTGSVVSYPVKDIAKAQERLAAYRYMIAA